MGLDPNLFTLVFQLKDGKTLEILQPTDDPQYHALKTQSSIQLIDPYTDLLLSSLTTLSPKLRLISLDYPPATVELKSNGGLSWAHEFVWEDVPFVWKREVVSFGDQRGYSLSVVRKPDPDWQVAIFRPSTPKNKLPTLQILDYNLSRLDPPVTDKKGLEILIVISVLSWLDQLFTPSSSNPTNTGTLPTETSTASSAPPLDPRSLAFLKAQALAQGDKSNGDATNSKGKGKEVPLAVAEGAKEGKGKGKERQLSDDLDQSQSRSTTIKGLNVNEVLVKDESKFDDQLKSCLSLLDDEALLYITLIATSPKLVPHAVKLAEEIKRRHYKSTGEELKQYLLPTDEEGPKRSPNRSDSTSPSAVKTSKNPLLPPSSLKIFLSRLVLDEFLPDYKKNDKQQQQRKTIPIRPPIVLSTGTPPTLPSRVGAGDLGGGKKLKKPFFGTS